MHAVVHVRADLENALRSTPAVIEQNDHVGPLRELDRGSLPRVGVAAHGLDDFDRRLGPAYPLDDFGENFGVAGDLTHQRHGAALLVRQTVDIVRPFEHVAAASRRSIRLSVSNSPPAFWCATANGPSASARLFISR